MLIAIVEIPRATPKPDKEAAVARALGSAPLYRKVDGPVSYTHLRAHETTSLIAYAVFCL